MLGPLLMHMGDITRQWQQLVVYFKRKDTTGGKQLDRSHYRSILNTLGENNEG